MASIKRKDAEAKIKEWLAMPYLEKTKAWNALLPYINAYKDVYAEIIQSRKPKKEQE